MKQSWIKLYVEILNDPKMGCLPDWLWRRAIELFLAAGENGNDGLLQPVTQLAWRLHLDEVKLSEALRALSEVGVVHETPQGWFVTNFAKRQAAMTGTERSRFSRSRSATDMQRTVVDDATKMQRSSSSSDSGSVSEEGGGAGEGDASTMLSASVFRAYEQNIGPLVPKIADGLKADIDQYGADWVITAIEYAARQQKPSLAYIEGTLRGWKRDGLARPSAQGNGPGGGKKPANQNEQILKKFAEKHGVKTNG